MREETNHANLTLLSLVPSFQEDQFLLFGKRMNANPSIDALKKNKTCWAFFISGLHKLV